MTQDDKAANSHCKCFIFAVILLLVAVFMLWVAILYFDYHCVILALRVPAFLLH